MKVLRVLRISAVVMMFLAISTVAYAQAVSFSLKTSPSLHFDFNTVDKYISGLTFMNACELNVVAVGTQWDLYVGATTTVAGVWDVSSVYSTSGLTPPIDILQLKFRNASGTALVAGFFPIQDILTPTYIIGSAISPDVALACPANGTNQSGSYLVSPGCYKFNVDMKITPGLSYQSGLYSLRVDYIIVQDL